jgi:putative protease
MKKSHVHAWDFDFLEIFCYCGETIDSIFMTKQQNAEIMAPVGSFASLSAAINAGADSVYFGVTQLNMRAQAAANMSIDDIEKIVHIAHDANVKVYLVVNTLLYDHDIGVMRKIIDTAKECDVDAIIAFDFACVNYCNDVGIPVHISVQFSVSNYESVKFFAQFTNRVVLARELNLDQIKTIHGKIQEEGLHGREGRLMEIEAFAHGALCIAQSGRCYMSLYNYNTSANRGACRQNCRMKYTVTDTDTGKEMIIDNNYILSAADICTIDFLDKVLDAGVQVLKIEGRGRSPEYVDTVVRTYKKALKDIAESNYTRERIAEYLSDLATVFNRKLSHGNYYLGKEIGAYCDVYGSKATEEKEYIGHVRHYFPKPSVAEVKIDAGAFTVGDRFMFIGATTGVMKGTVKELRIDEKRVDHVNKGAIVTFHVPGRVRINDKLYLIKDRTRYQNGTKCSQ